MMMMMVLNMKYVLSLKFDCREEDDYDYDDDDDFGGVSERCFHSKI